MKEKASERVLFLCEKVVKFLLFLVKKLITIIGIFVIIKERSFHICKRKEEYGLSQVF